MDTAGILLNIKDILKAEGLSDTSKFEFILGALIMVAKSVDEIKGEVTEIKKVIPLYKILTAIGGLLLTLSVGLLWAIFTGQAQIIFK